jgi:hypothetical protein
LLAAALLWLPQVLSAASNDPASAGSVEQSKKSREGDTTLSVQTERLKYGCFYAREVSNWDALNRNYLIAYAPSKSRAYLVYFSPPSFELRSASIIGFEGRERICGKPGERLVVGSGIGRGPGMNYTIIDVWHLDKVRVEQLLENKKARDSAVAVPAGESPGAEVETDIKAVGDKAEKTDTDSTQMPDAD